MTNEVERVVRRVKEALKHIYFAIRHGDWDCGWGGYKDKPMFGFYHVYYDGDYATFHFLNGWIGVHY